MEDEAVRVRLPEAYQMLLRLKDQGLPETEIAHHLQVLPEAVGPLIRVAEAKLLHLRIDSIASVDSLSEIESD